MHGLKFCGVWAVIKKTLCAVISLVLVCRLSAGEISLVEMDNETAIQCGNLMYGGTQTSVCFADHFLTLAASETKLHVRPNFLPVQLGSDAVFKTPFCVWSGEGAFTLRSQERENLQKYLKNGGFIVASPGCSNADWDRSFRNELKICFPDVPLQRIPMNHTIFSIVYNIPRLTLKHGGETTQVEALTINGRVVLVYSREGLNDATHAKGCCCCGGDQINEGEQVNVNLITYALLY
jgi:hypothetical protein